MKLSKLIKCTSYISLVYLGKYIKSTYKCIIYYGADDLVVHFTEIAR